MKLASTTNVKPTYLNYAHYTRKRYEQDIVNAIPFHKELHERLIGFLTKKFGGEEKIEVLDLGTGTGLSSALVRDFFPQAHFDLVDFSKRMLTGAKQRMGKKNVRYIFADFALLKLDKQYDVIMTVIGLHHQTSAGTRHLIKKAYKHLKPGGFLVIGDLVTYADKFKAALNNARHYHYLVEKAVTEKALTEWAHHHMFLNDLKTIEDHRLWLKDAEFELRYEFSKWNTVLLISKRA